MIVPFQLTNYPIAYALLALVALAIGSLLNVIIYRLPHMLFANWQREYQAIADLPLEANKFNLFLPRSFCPYCKTPIPAKYNIPLVGYLILAGKCHCCKKAISLRYPFVELLTCLISLFCAWQFGFSLKLLFALFFVWTLIALFFIDLEQKLLPDCLTIGLLWLGLIANTLAIYTTLPDAVLSAVGAYLSLWIFIHSYYLLTGKIGMGYGDFKLFAAFGAWFGWSLLPIILLIASLAGAIGGIGYLKMKNKTTDTPIPFGPFLCTAGIIALFWGKTLLQWYLSLWLI